VPRVFVVANAPEGERIAGWLAELPAEIQVGDGSDDTLAILQAAPAQVVVLTAGLETGDALAFAGALWDSGSEAQLVLVADDGGPVKTALDAMEFRADRFLRRPLSRSALLFAVKSCLNLASFGRPGVAQAVAVPHRNTEGRRPLSAAFAALGEIGPASASSPADVSSNVALHTLATRIEQATSDAVDAVLLDAVEQVLAGDPDEAEHSDDIAEIEEIHEAPAPDEAAPAPV
jgi:DNA-binding NarL/FixJ family response regulator